MGTNVSTNYITCPADAAKTLGIKLPFLVMIIKNLKKYFTFEVQVLDDKNVRRRFRASNYQSTTRVKQPPLPQVDQPQQLVQHLPSCRPSCHPSCHPSCRPSCPAFLSCPCPRDQPQQVLSCHHSHRRSRD